MEEVAYVEYDKNKFAGQHITEAERKQYDLPEEKKREEL